MDISSVPSIPSSLLTSVNSATTQFSSMTTTVSSSCDLMGTVNSLASEVVHTVVDSVTGAVTTVKRLASDVANEIKEAISKCFSGSGQTMNKIKGYIAQAQDLMNTVKSKIQSVTASVMSTIQSLMSDIQGLIATATAAVSAAMGAAVAAVGSIQTAVASAVSGVKLATCSAISSVLAGTPNDAFANITSGASDATTASLGAAKSVFNTGANSMSAVTSKIVEGNGVGNVLKTQGDAMKGAANVADAQLSNMAGLGSKMSQLSSIVKGIA